MEYFIPIVSNSKLFNTKQSQLLLYSLYELIAPGEQREEALDFTINHRVNEPNADLNESGIYGTVPNELKSQIDCIYKKYIDSELKYKIHTKVIHLMEQLQDYQTSSFQPISKKSIGLRRLIQIEYQEMTTILSQIQEVCEIIKKLGFLM